jgi:hypothetical protein
MNPNFPCLRRIGLAAMSAVSFTITAHAHPGHDDGADAAPTAPPFFLAQAGPPPPAPATTTARNEVAITVEGEFRVIRSNGIPDHATGQFPNRGNPNRISPQHYEFRVPLRPVAAASPTPLQMQPFGVAVNGVVFDPGANEWWNNDRSAGWQFEPLKSEVRLGIDQNNAHVQPNGAYHYHAIPPALLDRLSGGKAKPVLVGWAADGFPIYGPWDYGDARNATSPLKKMKSSYRVKSGARPSGPGGAYTGAFVQDWAYAAGSGDLDECNGRFGVTPEFAAGIYHYVLTEDWPFIPRMYRGTPDDSFRRKGPPGGPPGGFGPPRGPGGPPPGPF